MTKVAKMKSSELHEDAFATQDNTNPSFLSKKRFSSVVRNTTNPSFNAKMQDRSLGFAQHTVGPSGSSMSPMLVCGHAAKQTGFINLSQFVQPDKPQLHHLTIEK